MAKKDIKFTLDTIDSRYSPVGTVKQLDSVFFHIKITENGVTKDLTGQTIKLFAIKEDKKIVEQTTKINITNQSEGLVEIELLNAAIQVHGFTYFELEISDSNGIISTADFILRVNKRVGSPEAIESTNEVSTLKEIEVYVAQAKQEIKEFKTLQSEMLKTNETINSNETSRVEAESIRMKSEESRVSAEIIREEKINKFSSQVTKNANELYKINSNLKVGKNLFNKYSNNNIDGAMLDQNGALYDKAKNMFVSDYIGINSSSTISFFNFKTLINSNLNVVEYDINKNKVNVNQNVQGTITVNALTKYIRFSYLLENKQNVFLCYGDSIDEFEDYFIKINSLKISKSNLDENLISDNMIEDNAINPQKTSFVEMGKNLLNKNNLIDGVQLDNKGNLVDYMATERTSLDFLEVKPDTTYSLTGSNPQISFFNKFKQFIKIVNTSTFTTTHETNYIRLTINKKDKEIAQLETGEATSYEDYCVKIPLFKDDKINKNLKKINNDILELKNNSNIIQEKKINITLCNLYPVDASITVSENSQKTSTSSIENFTKIKSIDNGVINTVYRYTNAQICKAGDVYPRENYIKSCSVTKDRGEIGGNFFAVEFNIDCKDFEAITLGTGGSYKLAVDDGSGLKYTNADEQKISEPDGAVYLTKIVFKDKRIRKVRLELTNTIFGGLNIKRTDTVFPVGLPELPLACFTGSSITEGGYPWLISQILGLNGINVGVGSTGYLEPGLNNRLKYIDRADHDIIKPNPEVVFIEGGINDSGHPIPDVVREADRLYKHIKSNLPNAKIVVIGMYWPRTPSESVLNMNKALRECALANSIPFIDLLKGDTVLSNGTLVTEGTGSFISGTGKDGSLRNDGNADIYTSSDSTHPTESGKVYLATRLATEIYKILK